MVLPPISNIEVTPSFVPLIYKRRPSISQQVIQGWKPNLKTLRSEVDDNHIIKVNETAWRLFLNGIVTWGPPGSDSVQVNTVTDEK
jgi:hypothetical protein